MNGFDSKSYWRSGLLAPMSCALGLGLALGCSEPQVSLGQRPPRLTLAGTFDIAEDDASAGDAPLYDVADLVLRFRSDDAMHAVPTDWEVDRREFRLQVLDSPPPSAVLRPLSERWPEEPKLAIGFVAALREEREGRIPNAWFRGTRIVPESEAKQVCGECGGPPKPPGFNATGTCMQRQFCTLDDEECYAEYLCCPASCGECSSLGSRGDPALKVAASSYFGGYVTSHAVLYLADAVEKGTWGAYLLGAPEGLARGYHLLRARELSAETFAQARDCIERALEMAAAHENQRSQTDFTATDWLIRTCWSSNLWPLDQLGPPSSFMPICLVAGTTLPPCEPTPSEFPRQVERTMMELGCPAVSGGYLLEPVSEPGAEPLTLELGRRVRPPFFPLAFETDEPLQIETAAECELSRETPNCISRPAGDPMMRP